MDSNDILALAALVVALIALINTVAQVLQQYFASADGYRRCSVSVMGEWARFTKRRFKWWEFRFETVFATPTIFLGVAYDLREMQLRDPDSVVILDGTEEMAEWPGIQGRNIKTLPLSTPSTLHRWPSSFIEHGKPTSLHHRESSTMPSVKKLKDFIRRNSPLVSAARTPLQQFMALDKDPAGRCPDNEYVSWIPLMQTLHQYSSSLISCGMSTFQDVGSGSLLHGRILAPAVRVNKKSWDFMPAELTKPVALTNIRDMVTMVQLIGCRWTSFKPEEGILRAEGDGINITSAEVRSLGTVVSFTKTDSRIEDRRQLHGIVFSPFEGATNLGFGIIQSDLLGGEIYRIHSVEDCQDTIQYLGNSMLDHPTGLPRPLLQTVVTDILGILTPVYRPRNTVITYLVRPSEFVSDNVVSTRGSIDILLSDTAVSTRGSMRSFIRKVDALRFSPDLLHLDGCDKSNKHLDSICAAARGFIAHSHWHRDFGRPVISFKRYEEQAVKLLLESLHNMWDTTTMFLSTHRVAARAVLGVHITALLDIGQDIVRVQRQLPLRYARNAAIAQEQLMELYFDKCLIKCMNEVSTMMQVNRGLIVEVWVSLLFRGMLWHAIHNFDHRVLAVAPRYADCTLPVYVS